MKKKLLLMAATLLVGLSSVWAQRDVTSQYITNATLSSLDGWTNVNFNTPQRGNNTVGYASECYAGWGSLEKDNYSLKQTITLPAGNYRLVNYSFYRYGANDGTHTNLDTEKSLGYLFAGDNNVKISALYSVDAASYANSQAEGANCFDSKMYRNVVEFNIAADNTPIEIGIQGTHEVTAGWIIVGQFELFDLDDLASVSSPTDVTYAITNSGFEYRNLKGWTNGITKGNNQYANNNNFGSKAGVGFYESWNSGNVALGSAGTFTQTLANMPAGLYELSVYAQNIEQGNNNAGGTGMYVTANSDQTEIGVNKQYKVRTILQTDGDLTIGIKLDNCTGNWISFDRFGLQFYGDPLKAYQDLLDAAVQTAQAYIDSNPALSAGHIATLQSIVDANDNDDRAFTEESQFNTAIETIENAVTTYKALVAPYAEYVVMKEKANGIKSQTTSYTDTEGTAVSTLENVINTADAVVESATTAADISTQTENVRKAAFAFLGNVTLNENATIDITAFITNAGFDEDLTSGWNIADYAAYDGNNSTWHSYATSYSCGEFYQAKFDISQTLTDLPAGKSFKLKVQAFQRPGEIAPVYNAYGNSEDKTKNVTSEIYVNEKAQKIKNIVSEYSTTELFDGTGVDNWMRDSNPADGVYVPNSMKGASVYFDTDYTSGIKFYESEVAAAANSEGTLQFGFRDNTSGVGAWTIFDNFRLYYAGDDLSGFAADLAAVISSVKTAIDGMTIADAVKTKLKAIADSYEKAYASADEYTAAITAVNSIETIGARYETVASLTKNTENVGNGVFQYNSSTNDELWTVYSTANTDVESYNGTTLTGFETLLYAVETAASNYQNQTLNVPDANSRYNLIVATEGHAKAGNAVIIVPGNTNEINLSGYVLNADFAPNVNLAQAVAFTQVSGNDYTINFVTAEGTAYLTYGVTNGSAADYKNYQIQATTDETKAGEFRIVATATDNVFNIVNTKTNTNIDCQAGGNIYTDEDITLDGFSVSEASKASVDVNIDADVKYGTRIFPFTPELPAGVKAYTISVNEENEDVLDLTEVSEPEANVPYIVYAENGYSGASLENWGIAAMTSYPVGLLTGTYVRLEKDALGGNYILQKHAGDVTPAFYRVDATLDVDPYLAPNRCYLTDTNNSSKLRFSFGEEDATAINGLEVLTSGKYDAIYNAAGVKVNALQKGVNIIQKGGKSYKIFVK